MKTPLTKAQLQWIIVFLVVLVLVCLLFTGKSPSRPNLLSIDENENLLPSADQKWKWVIQRAEQIQNHLAA